MSGYLVFAITNLALLLGAISNTALAVAFPVLVSDFHSSLIAAGWVLAINPLAATAAMPIAGKASDILGRKFIFVLCICLFTLGSLLSALAPNIEWLIVFRLLQGLGAGGMMPSAMGMVADAFPEKRQQMIGLFTSVNMVGQITGPILGGWLTTAYGWRSIFWFNIPLGIIDLIFAAYLLKSSLQGQGTIDLVGAGLFTGSISALMVGLTILGGGDTSSLFYAAILFALCAVLIIVFVRYEKRIKDPIIDMEIIRERPFMAANLFNFVFGLVVIGIFSFMPLYVVTVFGMSTLESGLTMTPRSLGIAVTSVIVSFNMVRWGYRKPMLIGTGMLVLGLFYFGSEVLRLNMLGLNVDGITLIILVLLITGVASGMIAPTSNNACIELMPHRVSTISGLRGMCRQAGGAIGVTVATLLMHSVGDIPSAFTLIFFGVACILIFSIPLILAMPSGPKSKAYQPLSQKKKGQVPEIGSRL
jgi:EmrB/QacA subfamily drug resistance transporter